MAQPSEKQLAFRADLIRENLYKAKAKADASDKVINANAGDTDPEGWYLDISMRTLPDIALMLALPEPETIRDCSEQISSLKSGGGLSYGHDHPEWARPVNARFVQAWGTDKDRLPKLATVAEIRAIATGAGNA